MAKSAAKNMFATAKEAPEAPRAKKGTAKVSVEIPGIEVIAAGEMIKKQIDAVITTFRGEADQAMVDHFVETGCTIHQRPENFDGYEGEATASCQLRQRASSSALRDDEIALLKEHNIPTEVITEREETFVINPAYLGDSKLMQRVGTALAKIPGIPEDFVQKQTGREKTVVAAAALDEIFKRSPEVAAQLIRVVGVLAIRPKLDADAAYALDKISRLLGVDDAA